MNSEKHQSSAQNTPGPLELADELMAMAPTMAAATAEGGAAVLREAAYQLRICHYADDLLSALRELIEACDDEALDDIEDERHAAALDRQSAALRVAQLAIAKAEGQA